MIVITVGDIVFALVIVLLVALFSRYIMSAYGEGFDDTTTLIVLSSSAIFSAVSNVVGSAIASRAKMWVGFIFNMIWAILDESHNNVFIHSIIGNFTWYIHTKIGKIWICTPLFYD